jgi:hypothetical protein
MCYLRTDVRYSTPPLPTRAMGARYLQALVALTEDRFETYPSV